MLISVGKKQCVLEYMSIVLYLKNGGVPVGIAPWGFRMIAVSSRNKHRKCHIFRYICEQNLGRSLHLELLTAISSHRPTNRSINNATTTGRFSLIMFLMDDECCKVPKIILLSKQLEFASTEICVINSRIFWLLWLRLLDLRHPRGIVDLSMRYQFYLDNFNRCWEKSFDKWADRQADRETDT